MGKGDDRRPQLVPDDEVTRRWRETFGSATGSMHKRAVIRCPKCGRDVGDYVRRHGERWCPWCHVKLEDGETVKQ